MRRPIGVTASAIVAILGSGFTLLFAAMAIASIFVGAAQRQPPTNPQFVIAGAAMFAAFAVIGIWTSVGLFRLRPWARASILVFSGFLAAGCIFSLLITMAVQIPPEFTARTAHTFRQTTAVMFGVPLAIAVWWLIQFNTQSTKDAFASGMAGPTSLRPLSITVIAWMSIFGGASCVLGILTRQPAFLFGAIFTGWAAGVFYAVFGALTLYIGKGLLDLREEARILAIGWSGFSFVHASLVTLLPPLRQRLLELQRSVDQNQQHPIPFNPGVLMSVIFVFAAMVAAVTIWFLIRNRAAFGQRENP